jgi:putative tricarboxylic transport membrane protein
MIETPNYVYEVSAMFLVATLAMLILGLSMVRTIVKILNLKNTILMPIVFILCAIGSFAISARVFDILVMLIFGIIGYAIRKLEFADAPLILGLILGEMLDENLRRSLMLTSGAITPLFTRPICIILIILIALTIVARSAHFKTMMSETRETVTRSLGFRKKKSKE